MAWVEDRWWKEVIENNRKKRVKKAGFGKGMRYKARWIGPDGKEASKSFPDGEKSLAQDYADDKEGDVRKGTYIDPQVAGQPFGAFARAFVRTRVIDESTRETMERRLRNHILPTFEHTPFSRIKPSTIRDWDASLKAKGLEASTREGIFAHMKAILNAAVDDGVILRNPATAKSVTAPKALVKVVTPWTHEQVKKVRAGIAERYRAVVDIGAGCGLRSGEIFGLSPDDVSADEIHVRRQVKKVRGHLCFGLPKNDRARKVPLPTSTAAALAVHLAAWPVLEITLPWEEPGGRLVTVPLVFTTGRRNAITRSQFMEHQWTPARVGASFGESDRTAGMHALRHFYASVLLEAGVSIKALSAYLGHHDPGYTLRTYTHLMPTSGGRAAAAVDALGGL